MKIHALMDNEEKQNLCAFSTPTIRNNFGLPYQRRSAYEREMQSPVFKDAFEKEYTEFALQELLLALSEEDEKSVRTLAKEAGLHPNAIQNLRSGKTGDIKLSTFLKIAGAYGYSLELVKGKKHIPVMPKADKQGEYQIV